MGEETAVGVMGLVLGAQLVHADLQLGCRGGSLRLGQVSRRQAVEQDLLGRGRRRPVRSSQVGAIHGYLARRVGRPLADDLASQVFTVAFERRRTFHLGTPSARPWLYGIASNLIRSNRRSEQRLLAAVARLAHRGPTANETGSADPVASRSNLAWALAELDPTQRDVLLLHYWAQLSYEEIAAALGIAPGTVASRLARARQRIRAALVGRSDDADPVMANVFPKEEQ